MLKLQALLETRIANRKAELKLWWKEHQYTFTEAEKAERREQRRKERRLKQAEQVIAELGVEPEPKAEADRVARARPVARRCSYSRGRLRPGCLRQGRRTGHERPSCCPPRPGGCTTRPAGRHGCRQGCLRSCRDSPGYMEKDQGARRT